VPKKSLNINPFHGGISEHSDARDIAHHELARSQNLTVSDIGKVRLIGRATNPLTKGSANIYAGGGMFRYASDRTISDGTESPSQYIVAADGALGDVYFYEKKSDGTTSWATTTVSMGGAFDPVFYYADGALRVHDANFTRSSKWFGYIDSGLYEDTANSNTPIHTITEFVSIDQKLKSFSDLSKTVAIRDGSTANPSSGNLSTSINIAYWTSDGGSWSGIYEFGACPVYKGGQEGPLTEASDKITLSEDKLATQLYVTNASHSPADDAAHDLGDDRIIGVNVYFRENGTQDFYFLQGFDLQKGGKDRWRKYDTASHTAYGIFSGSVALGADPASVSSYATTTITGSITNNASGFTGRVGYLRLIGGQTSPVYFNLTSMATGNHSIPIVNPGAGDRQFKIELLDENFFVIAESAIRTVTITDSGDAYPPGYDPDDPGDYLNDDPSGDPDDTEGYDV
tara:strand:- start:1969 stop:3336 length:1368 start_codon:yes stop_codon:yes gene_type:complete